MKWTLSCIKDILCAAVNFLLSGKHRLASIVISLSLYQERMVSLGRRRLGRCGSWTCGSVPPWLVMRPTLPACTPLGAPAANFGQPTLMVLGDPLQTRMLSIHICHSRSLAAHYICLGACWCLAVVSCTYPGQQLLTDCACIRSDRAVSKAGDYAPWSRHFKEIINGAGGS